MIEKTTDQWCNIESPKDIYASMIVTLYKFLLPIYSNTQTSSRIWQKVSDWSTLILEIAKFSFNTEYDRSKEATRTHTKTSLIRPAVSVQYVNTGLSRDRAAALA